MINSHRKAGSKCLVHCKMGISRSAATVIAYAMKEYGWDLDKAFDYVKERRTVTKPNPSFMRQLEEYQGILAARYLRKAMNALRWMMVFYSHSCVFSANRDTTNCGVLTLTAICQTTTSHCRNLARSSSACVTLIPITRPAASPAPR